MTFAIEVTTRQQLFGEAEFVIEPRPRGERVFMQSLRQREFVLDQERLLRFKFQSPDSFLAFVSAYSAIDDCVFKASNGQVGVTLSKWDREGSRLAPTSPAGATLGFGSIGKALNNYLYAFVVIEIVDVRPARKPSKHLIFSGSGNQRFGDGIKTAIMQRVKSGHVDFGTAYGVAQDVAGLVGS